MRVFFLDDILPAFGRAKAAGLFCRSVCGALLSIGAYQYVAGASATAATLLFKTGFEPGTALPSIPSSQAGPRAYFQYFSGTDNSTGFSWSQFPFQDAAAVGLHNEPYGSDLVANHFFNKLDTSVYHSGSQSLYLDIEGYTNGLCCPQVPLQSSASSNPAKQVYLRYWMMLPSSLATFLSGNTQFYWHTGTAWKTLDDYRQFLNFTTALDANSNPVYNTLHPNMIEDAGGINCSSNSPRSCIYTDPITGNTYQDLSVQRKFVNVVNTSITIPTGKWFEVEYYFKRSTGSDGEFDTAINGQTVAKTFGPNYGVDLEEIRDMYWVSLYSSFFPMSEWVDDLEIWDDPPCGQFPCGTSNTQTSWTGASPPVISCPVGVTGVVGTSLSFQVRATQNPTNWRVQSGNLPAGLSLNTSTGLISGTPASVGTTTCFIEAWNTIGRSQQWMEFGIK
jgi:hypothetical protein